MTDRQLIESALSEYAGRPFVIEFQQAIGGGCINDAYRIEGADQTYFVKANQPSFLPAFTTEALALKELAATQTLRVPQVITLLEGKSQAYLILEYIEPRPSQAGDWTKLAHQLAALHRIKQPYYGWTQDNRIGSTPQPNPRSTSWIDFFRSHRLEHMLRLCQSRGYLLPHADKLLEFLPRFFQNYTPSPSLLHGDLWSGNIAFTFDGSPFTFDPASYYGDRETDLAFTEFFGGFPHAFYAAYNEAFQLDPGYQERKILYNLYHCLNHVLLFGSNYTDQAESMTRQLLSS